LYFWQQVYGRVKVDANKEEKEPLIQDQQNIQDPAPVKSILKLTYNITKKGVSTRSFWLLLLGSICFAGVGSTYASNLGNMVLSLGGPEDKIITMEYIFSIRQAMGRVFFCLIILAPSLPLGNLF